MRLIPAICQSTETSWRPHRRQELTRSTAVPQNCGSEVKTKVIPSPAFAVRQVVAVIRSAIKISFGFSADTLHRQQNLPLVQAIARASQAAGQSKQVKPLRVHKADKPDVVGTFPDPLQLTQQSG